jgi:hypothetical protein
MIKEKIKELRKGKIFGCSFVKRSDGSIRTGSFRCGVYKHLHDGGLKYDPETHDLLPVFDMNKRGYRMIPIDSILEIHHKGQTWKD